MERSGFTAATVPTRTDAVALANIAPENLPPAALARMRRTNTVEYQNLYEPDPYRSVQQVSYRDPCGGKSRIEPGGCVSRGGTGFGSNTARSVGSPEDPRTHRTETSTTKTHYRHPDDVRGPPTEQVPNVVEHSGYWSAG
jgi:hypothetical protein